MYDELIKCPNCKEIYTTTDGARPSFLYIECGHSFCKICVNPIDDDDDQIKTASLNCFNCDDDTKDVTLNIQLNKIIESILKFPDIKEFKRKMVARLKRFELQCTNHFQQNTYYDMSTGLFKCEDCKEPVDNSMKLSLRDLIYQKCESFKNILQKLDTTNKNIKIVYKYMLALFGYLVYLKTNKGSLIDRIINQVKKEVPHDDPGIELTRGDLNQSFNTEIDELDSLVREANMLIGEFSIVSKETQKSGAVIKLLQLVDYDIKQVNKAVIEINNIDGGFKKDDLLEKNIRNLKIKIKGDNIEGKPQINVDELVRQIIEDCEGNFSHSTSFDNLREELLTTLLNRK